MCRLCLQTFPFVLQGRLSFDTPNKFTILGQVLFLNHIKDRNHISVIISHFVCGLRGAPASMDILAHLHYSRKIKSDNVTKTGMLYLHANMHTSRQPTKNKKNNGKNITKTTRKAVQRYARAVAML